MSSEVKVPEDREQIGGDPESLQVLKRVAKTVSSHEAWLKAEQPRFLHGLILLPVIGKIQRLKGCYIVTGHLCEGILNGCASIKLLNINKNNEKNNVVGKLQIYLLIKILPCYFSRYSPMRIFYRWLHRELQLKMKKYIKNNISLLQIELSMKYSCR